LFPFNGIISPLALFNWKNNVLTVDQNNHYNRSLKHIDQIFDIPCLHLRGLS
jgi:hypothetical protein